MNDSSFSEQILDCHHQLSVHLQPQMPAGDKASTLSRRVPTIGMPCEHGGFHFINPCCNINTFGLGALASLKFILDGPRTKKELLGQVSGSAITRLTITKLKRIPVPLPSMDEQQLFVSRTTNYLRDISALYKACQTELARSQSLRQAILKDAFAGRLVPQDPNNEPASRLLARIRAEREPAPSKRRRKAKAKS